MNYVGGGIKLKAFCNFIPANLANAILLGHKSSLLGRV